MDTNAPRPAFRTPAIRSILIPAFILVLGLSLPVATATEPILGEPLIEAPQPEPNLDAAIEESFAAAERLLASDPPPSSDSAVQAPPAAPPAESKRSIPLNNLLLDPSNKAAASAGQFQVELDLARTLRKGDEVERAARILTNLLDGPAPEEIKRPALLELAYLAQDHKQWTKAQHIYTQYTRRYPNDPSLPEVFLRQGLLYRQMGATTLALSKYYAVMTSALNLKLDRFEYYQRLVLQAQTEIAETYFIQGDFNSAIDFFSRLLKLGHSQLNIPQIQYKLIQALFSSNRLQEVEAHARDFLHRFAGAPQAAEVRFLLSSSLKQQGRNRDALEQVLILLQSQQATAATDPENWAYWQQRTGNEIANQLYREGDYISALEVYLSLAPLNDSPAWQFPVLYQTGLVYERLQQPLKAIESYGSITERASQLDSGASPGLKAVVEMATWRKNIIQWRLDAGQKTAEITDNRPLPDPNLAAQ